MAAYAASGRAAGTGHPSDVRKEAPSATWQSDLRRHAAPPEQGFSDWRPSCLARGLPFPPALKRSGGLQAGEVPAEISFLMLGLLEQMGVHHGVLIGGHAA